jgi:hypothetical protein
MVLPLLAALYLNSPPTVDTAPPIDTVFVKWKDSANKNEILSSISGVESATHYSNIPNLTLLDMTDIRSAKRAVAQLSTNPSVEFVEEDRWITVERQSFPPPNDT